MKLWVLPLSIKMVRRAWWITSKRRKVLGEGRPERAWRLIWGMEGEVSISEPGSRVGAGSGVGER